jgi:hypothetical protein
MAAEAHEPGAQAPSNYPYINNRLSEICIDANRIATDLLDLDGGLSEEAAARITLDLGLAVLRDEMQATIERDVNHRFDDPSSRLTIVNQEPFYMILPGTTLDSEGLYSGVSRAKVAAGVTGRPTGIRMVYHNDEVPTLRGLQQIPSVRMCLLLEDAIIQGRSGEAPIGEVLVPFSDFNRIVPALSSQQPADS